MAAAVINPLIGLGSSILGWMNQRDKNKLGATYMSEAASEGITRTEDATRRAMERILGTAAETATSLGQSNDWLQHILGVAGTGAQDIVRGGTSAANNLLAGLLTENRGYYDPYSATGSAAATKLGELTSSGIPSSANRMAGLLDNPASLENTPGYKFQLEQGLRGLEQSAAARGALQSGGMLRAITQYGQGLAGTTYQNAIANALQSDRLELDKTQQQFSNTLSATGMGLDAERAKTAGLQAFGAPQADNTMRGALYSGDVIRDTASGQASLGGGFAKIIADLNMDAAQRAAGVDIEGANSIVPLLAARAAPGAAVAIGNADLFSSMLTNASGGILDLFKAIGQKKKEG